MKPSPRRLTPLVVSLVLGFSSWSAAKDLCLASSGGVFAVLRKFRQPAPGSCRPVAGNSVPGFGILTGSACTRSDGAQLQILYTGQNDILSSFQNLFKLPLPSMTGGTLVTTANFDPNASTIGGMSAATCKGQPVP